MYNCGCEDCAAKSSQLNLSIGDSFKQLLNIGSKAFKRLHEIGSYKPQDLKTEKSYQDLINKTFDVFNFAITDNDMPNDMRTALQSDAFLFGGLKTHAQLFEASKLLLDNNGNLKPFNQLSNEFDKLNSTYNKNYLSAEYEFAVGSSQMAAKWSEFSDNDRYELQYRTAGDNRVRDEHAKLNGITLPKSDPFWSSYTPPNGWNCRCTTVEVLKGKYEGDAYLKDSEKAIKAGEAATTQIGKDGKNRLEIFRFNPGADKKLFPPKHPLYANRCTGDGKLSITGLIGAPVFILSAEKSKCEAAKVIEEIALKNQKSIDISKSRIQTKEFLFSRIKGKFLTFDPRLLNIDKLTLSKANIKTLVSHYHPNPIERDNFLINIEKFAKKGKYVGWAEDQLINGKQKHPDVNYWQYYEYKINNEKSFLSVKYTKDGLYKAYSIDAKKDFKKIIGIKKQNPIR